MKKTLIPKLIFGYVLFVVLGFIILCKLKCITG